LARRGTLFVTEPTIPNQVANKAYVDSRQKCYGGGMIDSAITGDMWLALLGNVSSATEGEMDIEIPTAIKILSFSLNVITNGHTQDCTIKAFVDNVQQATIVLFNGTGYFSAGLTQSEITAGEKLSFKLDTTDSGTMKFNYLIEYEFV